MTLSAFAWNIVRTYTLTPGRRYSFGCRYRLGTASIIYVSAADNDYVGVTGTFLGTASQGVWSTALLDFSAAGRNREAALWSLRRLPRAGAAVGGHAGPVQHADQGQRLQGRVSVTDLLADSLALTRAHRADQLLCNDVNCTDVFTTGVDALSAISCAALGATTSTGAVSGSSLSIPAELGHGNHRQHTYHQQHGQRRQLHPPGRSRAPR